MLYIIGTPIGNLKDITLRALEVFQEVDFVLSEAPTETIKIFQRYNLPRKKIIKYTRLSERTKNLVKDSKIAFVVRAGMPLVSDPGQDLVYFCQKEKIKIEVIPGPTALTAALSASGMVSKEFIFLGFLPKKSGRRKRILEKFTNLGVPIVIYESPHRLLDLLIFLKENFPPKEIFLAREMTKIYEEYFIGSPDELIEKIKNKKIKGEIVLILSY